MAIHAPLGHLQMLPSGLYIPTASTTSLLTNVNVMDTHFTNNSYILVGGRRLHLIQDLRLLLRFFDTSTC